MALAAPLAQECIEQTMGQTSIEVGYDEGTNKIWYKYKNASTGVLINDLEVGNDF